MATVGTSELTKACIRSFFQPRVILFKKRIKLVCHKTNVNKTHKTSKATTDNVTITVYVRTLAQQSI